MTRKPKHPATGGSYVRAASGKLTLKQATRQEPEQLAPEKPADEKKGAK